MYRKHHNGQLSIEEFHVPFGGTLDPENRRVLFSSLLFSSLLFSSLL
jgi:IS5 family transposase